MYTRYKYDVHLCFLGLALLAVVAQCVIVCLLEGLPVRDVWCEVPVDLSY